LGGFFYVGVPKKTHRVRTRVSEPCLSWSSIIPYLLPPPIAIQGILPVQFTCVTVFSASFAFLTGQVSLPCNILLCTQLLYYLPLTINDISLLVSNSSNCLNLFQFKFWSPQLHQHIHLHSTCIT